jgi:cell division cycle-associated protein 7
MAAATVVEPMSLSPEQPRRPPKNLSAAASSPVSPLEAASGYEAEREARIRENMARMQKLGILDLAQSVTQSAASTGGRGRWRKKPVEPGSIAAPGVKPAAPSPARRSLRCGANRLLLLLAR